MMDTVLNLILFYSVYVVAIGIAYKFEITIFEAIKKSVTLPLVPFSRLCTLFTPLTPLQKEIREEERTIKQLESQKVDMERLAALKRKREALFEEVGDKHVERVVEGHIRLMVDDRMVMHNFKSKKEAKEYADATYPGWHYLETYEEVSG